MLQNFDTADAVDLFVQRRTKDADAHPVDQRCRNAAAPIRNATSVKIGSEWNRPRSGWLTWMFFCPDSMRILSWAI